ncbi:MAG: glycoside hydrolase [Actinomycetota bacterium]|nr:glycoside hydrolase [Actinomycetota bacterium]
MLINEECIHHPPLPYLATSTDHGATWSKPLMIAPPNVREVQWPTVAAGANGRIVISFPGTTEKDQGDLTRPWDEYVVVSTNALADDPLFVSNIANPATDPVHRGDCPGRCGNMLDFLDAVVSPAPDHSVWATVVDTCTSENNCKNNADAKGFDDANGEDNAASDMRGIAIKQISGPNLGF